MTTWILDATVNRERTRLYAFELLDSMSNSSTQCHMITP